MPLSGVEEARALYDHTVRPDYHMMEEHMRRLNAHLRWHIENEAAVRVRYEVPELLVGGFVTYNRWEVTEEMLRRIRRAGYKVRVLRLQPTVWVEVSGWAPSDDPSHRLREREHGAGVKRVHRAQQLSERLAQQVSMRRKGQS